MERSIRPRRTITGRPVTDGEEIGSGQKRRARLMSAAIRQLEGHPLTVPDSRGIPLGDGHGMEELVATIQPLFATEASLTRWVALRGALLYLDMLFSNEQEWEQMLPIMGFEPTADAVTGAPRVIVLDKPDAISAVVKENIEGLFWAITRRWSQYTKIADMTINEVNDDPEFSRLGPAVALDMIAWTAAVFLRTDQAQSEIVTRMPEPDALEGKGWYVEPVFGKCERYWDGSDWTSRVRTQDGRRWHETEMPLR